MTTMHRGILACALAALAAGVMTAAAPRAADPAASPVTFTKDVLPILQRHCQSCHRPGQIAPMSLLTYADARPWARAITLRVAAREMPPWFADPAHGRFANERRLEPRDIDTLAAWADQGAPEGDPKDAPPPVTWPAGGWDIAPDVVVNGPQFPVPANGVVEWTYITVPSGVKTDTWVTSIEVRPTEPSVTHHICVSIVPHAPDVRFEAPEWEQRNRDDRGIEPLKPKGYQRRKTLSRWVQAAKRNGNEACYVPGTSALDLRPYGAAKLIPAGSDLVFTLHYTPNGKDVVDRPRVGFTVAREPPRRRYAMFVTNGPMDAETFRIPANDPNWAAPPVESVFTADAAFVWASPHMHLRGKDMTYTLVFPDGRSQIVLRVPRFDYNWQLGYALAEPIPVPKGTRLRVEAHYDNSRGNRYNPDPDTPVYWGDQNWEEMLSPFFGITLDPQVDPNTVIKPVNGQLGSAG
jgi:hypothetical protein